MVGSSRAHGEHRLELRQALGADPQPRGVGMQLRDAPLACQRGEPVGPARLCGHLVVSQEAEPHQRVVQLVGIGRCRPGLLAHARDRLGIEPAEIGGGVGIEPAPAHHRLGAALLERRVVEEGIGPRRQHFERERRGLGQIARDDAHRAASIAASRRRSHRCPSPRQAVGDRLAHQRVIGNLALADDVLGAGELVGKDRR